MPGPKVTTHALSRELLEREIDEIGEKDSADAVAAAIQRGFRRLHDCLSSLVGHEGFRALLARAVHRTSKEFPWLELVAKPTPEVLENPSEMVRREGAARIVEGSMTLMTNFVDLLCNFIGEDLTRRLVERVLADARRERTEPGEPEEGA